MQHEILFVNPVFHEGLNITVRAGDGLMKIDVGDELLCKETDTGELICEAKVVGKALVPFELIPETWLGFGYDHDCMDYPGLFRIMKEVYPNFTADSPVTVLLFNI